MQEWQDIEGKVLVHLTALSNEFDYGVKLIKFAIKEIDLSKEINEGFSAQVLTKISIQTERNKGLADKAFKELQALGNRALRREFLKGEAEGFMDIAEKLKLTEQQKTILLQSQVLRDALKEANFNLLSTEGLGIVGAIQQTLEMSQGKTKIQKGDEQ